MHWTERLRQECRLRGWGPRELAGAVDGLSHDLAKKYLGGKVDQPRGRKLEQIAARLGVYPQWLRDGTGERYVDGPPEGPHSYPKSTTHDSSAETAATSGIVAPSENENDQRMGSREEMKVRIIAEIASLLSPAPVELYEEVREFVRFRLQKYRSTTQPREGAPRPS